MTRPVVLCILDGWGLTGHREGNAPLLAATPVMDRLLATCPHATLVTHGPDVGLPEGQMGNSEVGHTTIGAGRVVLMDLPRIDQVVRDGALGRIPAVKRFAARLRATGGAAHVLGLTSPGGVHSHQSHMAAAARTLSEAGVPVVLHLVTDGRDVPPDSALKQVSALLEEVGDRPDVGVGTLMGRFFAMDRDHRWDRVERAYRAIREGAGRQAPGALPGDRGGLRPGRDRRVRRAHRDRRLPRRIGGRGAPLHQLPRRPGARDPGRAARPRVRRLRARRPAPLRRGSGDGVLLRAARRADGRGLPPTSPSRTAWAPGRPHAACASSASPRRRSIPTSRSS